MIPGLLASEVAAALREFIAAGLAIRTPPCSSEFRRNLHEGEVHETFLGDTLRGGSIKRMVCYCAPFFEPDREDYRVAGEIVAAG